MAPYHSSYVASMWSLYFPYVPMWSYVVPMWSLCCPYVVPVWSLHGPSPFLEGVLRASPSARLLANFVKCYRGGYTIEQRRQLEHESAL